MAIWPLEVYQSQFQRDFPTWTRFDMPMEMPLFNNGKTIVILFYIEWIYTNWWDLKQFTWYIHANLDQHITKSGVVGLWICGTALNHCDLNGFHLNIIEETPDLRKLIFHIYDYQTVCFYCRIVWSLYLKILYREKGKLLWWRSILMAYFYSISSFHMRSNLEGVFFKLCDFCVKSGSKPIN